MRIYRWRAGRHWASLGNYQKGELVAGSGSDSWAPRTQTQTWEITGKNNHWFKDTQAASKLIPAQTQGPPTKVMCVTSAGAPLTLGDAGPKSLPFPQ